MKITKQQVRDSQFQPTSRRLADVRDDALVYTANPRSHGLVVAQRVASFGPRAVAQREFQDRINRSIAVADAMRNVRPALLQRAKAKGGSDEVNPEFETGKNAFDRLKAYISLGAIGMTVGIASRSVLDAAGVLWEASAPDATTRTYKEPVDKGKPRGWQANFWERPAKGGDLTVNLHISMLP